ncbi:MAG: transglycosylase SLT domain-containing protein [Immundisolibacter sp.]|uniref:transglycosylase SLT domain-containing protein n=1 Tax=Immundisolibacter sp. TaxID=1934948 RepID=UPI001987286C|nr:transglycosylase SLT domain-containing protein [Immundisolibacter sp.]MBC7162715.1 transglycosylase SLT domain-containing protein [Immundisolibacter sp.]
MRNLAAFLLGVLLLALLARCADAVAAPAVPQVAVTYRLAIEREAVRNFGLAAPVARLAAQVHQESGWNPRAASPYAQGLTQFTPATARWLPTVCPAVGPPDPWDPQWSLRAQACYMAWLYNRVQPMAAGELHECSHWALTLRKYNGGERMLDRERRAALRDGADPDDWRAVEAYRVRAAWAHRENTAYPRRILLRLEPAYLAAGWTGEAVCP